jgi:hypothetical protein
MNGDYSIPAATVQDVDLSGANPVLATQVRELGALMERGEETPEQFAQLIRLLVQIGHGSKAEYLLRRNLETVEDGLNLYKTLFGTSKADEFAAAVKAFEVQFGIGLEFVCSRGFLDTQYRTGPGLAKTDTFELLKEPCEVWFDFADPDVVAADVLSTSSEEYMLLRWVGGVWKEVQ